MFYHKYQLSLTHYYLIIIIINNNQNNFQHYFNNIYLNHNYHLNNDIKYVLFLLNLNPIYFHIDVLLLKLFHFNLKYYIIILLQYLFNQFLNDVIQPYI